MKRIPPKEVINLENAIAPETFAIKGEVIFYFDRINRYEGRFCKLGKEIEYLVTEVDESQGILTHEGEEYLININDSYTRIERLSTQGEWLEIINLEGIFFDLKKNETDNYVCLGNENSVTSIKIFNAEGWILNDIRPDNIIFGSSIYLHSEYIYLGAVDNNNKFKILKINYLGNIEAYWDIKINSQDRIISKICIYYNYIFMLVEGRKNSLVILDRVDGSFKEIFSQRLEVNSIMDFDIYNDNIYILNGKSIYTWKCYELTCIEGSKSSIKLGLSLDFLYYRYHIYSKGLKDQIKFSLLAAAFPTILIYNFLSNLFFQQINGFQLLRITFCLYIIISYFIASIKNIFTMGKKERRIEYLLSSSREYEFKRKYEVPLFFGMTAFAIVEFGMYPKSDIITSILVLLLTSLVFYGIDYLCVKNIRTMNKDMVVELLEDFDNQTFDYIRNVVKNLRQGHAEKFHIEIVSRKKINEKSLARWENTRNYILGQSVIVHLEDNKIITEMDLSKRDIKYSRFSIIMDYVCFIKSIGEIQEIQVEYTKKNI